MGDWRRAGGQVGQVLPRGTRDLRDVVLRDGVVLHADEARVVDGVRVARGHLARGDETVADGDAAQVQARRDAGRVALVHREGGRGHVVPAVALASQVQVVRAERVRLHELAKEGVHVAAVAAPVGAERARVSEGEARAARVVDEDEVVVLRPTPRVVGGREVRRRDAEWAELDEHAEERRRARAALQPDEQRRARVAVQRGPVPVKKLRVRRRVHLEEAREGRGVDAGQRADLARRGHVAAGAQQRREQAAAERVGAAAARGGRRRGGGGRGGGGDKKLKAARHFFAVRNLLPRL